MKKISIIVTTLACLAVLTQNKKEQATPANDGKTVDITLDIKSGKGTRMDVNTATGEVTYVSGDKIYVASGGKYVGTLTHNGTRFSGAISDPTVGEPLHFYFLGNVTPAETLTAGTTTTCSVVISDQTQHLPVIEYAPSNETYNSGATAFTAHLLNKCALVKFNVTTASDAATCITGMKNKVTVNFAENNLTHSQEGNGVITLPAGSGEKWAILLPQEAMEGGNAYSEDGEYTGTCGAVPAIYDNGYLVTGIDVNVTNEIVHTHEFVDLGLPSGLLWATCNVGANAPEKYGDYFAWGETELKTTYNWSNYQYCNGSCIQLTKYCNDSYYGYSGFTDNLITLLSEDDAATSNWGTDWRMPTMEEWQELYQNTTYTWTTQNGVRGGLFTSSNGNNLFLPAAGSSYNEGVGNYGNYWSSSLNTNFPDEARCCSFNLTNVWIGYNSNGDRCSGLSVRPVHCKLSVIDVTVNPTEGGNISGGGSYQDHTRCTVSATANDDYVFLYWKEDGRIVSTEATYTFIVNGNRSLVANFTMGAVDGKFTINADGDQVYFSQGNLQCSGSTWRFAEHQYDYIGDSNSNPYNDWIDLFGWGTSGWYCGNLYYHPWDYDNSSGSAYGPPGVYDLTGSYAFSDWGVYNQISNGGNTYNQWRTLSQSEWDYVFNTRNTTSGIRYAKANVNNVNGVILLPDNWNSSTYNLNNTNINNANFSSNTITASQWTILENAGTVFLPAAGNRYGTDVFSVGTEGNYWSASSSYEPEAACNVSFGDSYLYLFPDGGSYRYFGHSVRLIVPLRN